VKLFSRVALVLTLGAPLIAQDEAPRLVAIGDIHGSLDGFTAILKAAGLTGDDGRWSGGRTIFIQTGDYMDRGPGVRAVMDRLMALEGEAKSAGGRAQALLGNHEVMNLIGHTRDATPAIFATFADDKSEARQQDEWEDYSKLASAKKKGDAVPSVYGQTRDAWMAAHPAGYIEYRTALGPKGKYGAWLRDKSIVVNVDGTILMHAGIAPESAPEKPEDLNQKVKDEISRLDRFRQRMIEKKLMTPSFTLQEMLQAAVVEIEAANAAIKASNEGGPGMDPEKIDLPFLKEAVEVLKVDEWNVLAAEGPLWYRGYAQLPDDPSGGPFTALLTKYNARRFVVAHTPQQTGHIAARFGGRAFVIDTGMLKEVYNGRGSALEVKGSDVTAIYEDGRVPLGGASTGADSTWLLNQSTVFRSPSSSRTAGR
jgi:Calcineurin-like phosphoesterase